MKTLHQDFRILTIIFLTLILLYSINFSAELYTPDQEEQGEKSPMIIHIEMNEFSFRPDSLVIPAGQLVRLEFVNTGKINHEFMAGRKVTEDLNDYMEDLFQGVEFKMTRGGEQVSAVGMPQNAYKNEKNEHSDGHDEHGHQESHNNHEQHVENHGTMLLLDSGEKGTMTFMLPASKKGKWEIGCFTDRGSHYRAGMKGVLVVE